MSHIIAQPEVSYQYHMAKRRPSLLSRFFTWAANEDAKHHIGWVGATVTSMTAVFFPATMAVILVNGADFELIVAAMASLVLVVVTNLAAMKTKFTIPFFFLGILIDIAAVIASFFVH